jgi:hypothetical protein
MHQGQQAKENEKILKYEIHQKRKVDLCERDYSCSDKQSQRENTFIYSYFIN